ncbi:MAG: hypothetical protein HETSPECPRED_010316 [Heterodermia speciosa]|uniref:Killer toxin Kp4 domain-containing protein n=1 Tax=Heterodermia speciosa TaxID=116794 RepID=A0A8H3GB08_9LECA|nr:MAG: hypothetical protein HETSPECPRED_010316 [Heterodermia speciosa]
MHFTTATILGALAAIPLASGLGINCRGSYGCTGSSDTMKKLQAAMASGRVPSNAIFPSGQQIICNANNICVFFQNTSTDKSEGAAQLGLNDLVAHGCNVCGSDPTEPGNDVSKGQLTVNFVQTASPVYGFV